MSLTQNDLQAIGTLIDEKLKNELSPIKQDINGIKKELHSVKKLAIKIDKNTTDLVDFLDKDVMSTTKRVDKILGHPTNLSSLND